MGLETSGVNSEPVLIARIPTPEEAAEDRRAAERAMRLPPDPVRPPDIRRRGETGSAAPAVYVDPYQGVKGRLSQLEADVKAAGAMAETTPEQIRVKRAKLQRIRSDALSIRGSWKEIWIKSRAERVVASATMNLLRGNPADDSGITGVNLNTMEQAVRSLDYARTQGNPPHSDVHLYHDLIVATALKGIFIHALEEKDPAALDRHEASAKHKHDDHATSGETLTEITAKAEKHWKELTAHEKAPAALKTALLADASESMAGLYLSQRNFERAAYFTSFGVSHMGPGTSAAKRRSLQVSHAKVLAALAATNPAKYQAAKDQILVALGEIAKDPNAKSKLESGPAGWKALYAKLTSHADQRDFLELLAQWADLEVVRDSAQPGSRSKALAQFINANNIMVVPGNRTGGQLVSDSKLSTLILMERESERFKKAMELRRTSEKTSSGRAGYAKAEQELAYSQKVFQAIRSRALAANDHETAVRAAHWNALIQLILVKPGANEGEELDKVIQLVNQANTEISLVKGESKKQELSTRLQVVEAEVMARRATLAGDRGQIRAARQLFLNIAATAAQTGPVKDVEMHVRARFWVNALTLQLGERVGYTAPAPTAPEGEGQQPVVTTTDLEERKAAYEAVAAELADIKKAIPSAAPDLQEEFQGRLAALQIEAHVRHNLNERTRALGIADETEARKIISGINWDIGNDSLEVSLHQNAMTQADYARARLWGTMAQAVQAGTSKEKLETALTAVTEIRAAASSIVNEAARKDLMNQIDLQEGQLRARLAYIARDEAAAASDDPAYQTAVQNMSIHLQTAGQLLQPLTNAQTISGTVDHVTATQAQLTLLDVAIAFAGNDADRLNAVQTGAKEVINLINSAPIGMEPGAIPDEQTRLSLSGHAAGILGEARVRWAYTATGDERQMRLKAAIEGTSEFGPLDQALQVAKASGDPKRAAQVYLWLSRAHRGQLAVNADTRAVNYKKAEEDLSLALDNLRRAGRVDDVSHEVYEVLSEYGLTLSSAGKVNFGKARAVFDVLLTGKTDYDLKDAALQERLVWAGSVAKAPDPLTETKVKLAAVELDIWMGRAKADDIAGLKVRVDGLSTTIDQRAALTAEGGPLANNKLAVEIIKVQQMTINGLSAGVKLADAWFDFSRGLIREAGEKFDAIALELTVEQTDEAGGATRKLSDPTLLDRWVSAKMGAAGVAKARNMYNEARTIYQEILEVDKDNAAAQEAFGRNNPYLGPQTGLTYFSIPIPEGQTVNFTLVGAEFPILIGRGLAEPARIRTGFGNGGHDLGIRIPIRLDKWRTVTVNLQSQTSRTGGEFPYQSSLVAGSLTYEDYGRYRVGAEYSVLNSTSGTDANTKTESNIWALDIRGQVDSMSVNLGGGATLSFPFGVKIRAGEQTQSRQVKEVIPGERIETPDPTTVIIIDPNGNPIPPQFPPTTVTETPPSEIDRLFSFKGGRNRFFPFIGAELYAPIVPEADGNKVAGIASVDSTGAYMVGVNSVFQIGDPKNPFNFVFNVNYSQDPLSVYSLAAGKPSPTLSIGGGLQGYAPIFGLNATGPQAGFNLNPYAALGTIIALASGGDEAISDVGRAISYAGTPLPMLLAMSFMDVLNRSDIGQKANEAAQAALVQMMREDRSASERAGLRHQVNDSRLAAEGVHPKFWFLFQIGSHRPEQEVAILEDYEKTMACNARLDVLAGTLEQRTSASDADVREVTLNEILGHSIYLSSVILNDKQWDPGNQSRVAAVREKITAHIASLSPAAQSRLAAYYIPVLAAVQKASQENPSSTALKSSAGRLLTFVTDLYQRLPVAYRMELNQRLSFDVRRPDEEVPSVMKSALLYVQGQLLALDS